MSGDGDTQPWEDTRPGSLQRHPNGGWQLPDPLPLAWPVQAALHAVIAALLPVGAAGAPDSADVRNEVDLAVRTTMRCMAQTSALGLQLVLLALDWSPLWCFRSLRRLGRHAPSWGSAWLDRLAHSRLGPLRMMVLAARAAVATAYYDLPEVHIAIGYDGAAHMAERIAARQALLAGADPETVAAPLPPGFVSGGGR